MVHGVAAAPARGFSVLALSAVLSCAPSSAPVPAVAPAAASPTMSGGAGVAAPPATGKEVPSAGPLAEPSPLAASCITDADCAPHRCNTARGKCAFPCATDADCASGATCMKGVVPTCLARALVPGAVTATP